MSENELVSIRGLIEGVPRTPLREFKGKLEGYATELVTRFQPARTYINLDFSELEVIETTEAYPFPIAKISMPFNKRRVSQWTIFSDSLAGFIPDDKDLKDTIGMQYHLKFTPGHMMWNKDMGKPTARESWEVIGLFGAVVTSKVDATEVALGLLDGKNEEEWNQSVFQSPAVKGDSKLIDDIIHRRFLPAMETAGRITKNSNGIWHTKPVGP